MQLFGENGELSLKFINIQFDPSRLHLLYIIIYR